MSVGNTILINGTDPKGRFLEGIISGTPKPGTCMQVKAATEPVNGRHTWEVYDVSGAQKDAIPSLVAVLLEDSLQGKTVSDAYASGDRCFLYCPLPGDELNMIIADISGTADDYAIGDILQIQDGTGKLEDAVAGTAFNYSRPFIVMETVTDPAADNLTHCMYTGH